MTDVEQLEVIRRIIDRGLQQAQDDRALHKTVDIWQHLKDEIERYLMHD